MRGRRVIMSVNGQDGEPMDVTTGLPQGSPISPAPFAIYIADIHEAVEDQVEGSRGISYMDDVTWVVERTDADDVVSKRFGGRIVVEKKEEALRIAKEWDRPDTVWTDGGV